MKILISILLLLSVESKAQFCCALAAPAVQTAHNRKLTIDHTKIPNTNLSNFTATIFGTGTYLKTVANGGKVQNSNGYDILITRDSAGTNIVPFERTYWSGTTGDFEFHWLETNASPTVDSIFWLQYGNTSITTDLSNPSAAWDTSVKMVQHFPNGTTLSVIDPTSNAVNGTVTGATATVGQEDGGIALSGTSQYVNFGNKLALIGSFSISAWVNPTDFTNYNGVLSKTAGGAPKPYDYRIDQTTGKAVLFVGNGTGNTSIIATTAVTANAWNYIVVTFDQTTATITHYLNGNANGSSVGAGYPGSISGTDNTYLGTRSDLVTMFKGKMDEVIPVGLVWSADRIKANYNNINSVSTFVIIGSEN